MSPDTTHLRGHAPSYGEQILVVCTANICRSPMAETLLGHEASIRHLTHQVSSAGVQAVDGNPVAAGSLQALGTFGHDLSAHRSRRITAPLLDSSDLVITMEARHLIDVVGGHPERFARSFTLRELVQRAVDGGPRNGRPLTDWLEAISRDRTTSALMSATGIDVDDPYGGPAKGYRSCAATLVELTGSLARSLWGPPPSP